MQLKFLVVFFLLGACFAQASEVHLRSLKPNIQRGVISNAIKEALKAIEKVSSVLENQLKESLGFLTGVIDQVRLLASGAIEGFTGGLNELIENSMKEIEKIASDALHAGIDITKCLASNGDLFKNLFDKFLASEVHCVTYEVDQVLEVTTDTLKFVKETITHIASLPGKLAACGEKLTSLICITRVTAEALDMTIKLPIKLTNKVAKVTKLVAVLPGRLTQCATAQLSNAAADASKIVKEVAQCADDKMNEH